MSVKLIAVSVMGEYKHNRVPCLKTDISDPNTKIWYLLEIVSFNFYDMSMFVRKAATSHAAALDLLYRYNKPSKIEVIAYDGEVWKLCEPYSYMNDDNEDVTVHRLTMTESIDVIEARAFELAILRYGRTADSELKSQAIIIYSEEYNSVAEIFPD